METKGRSNDIFLAPIDFQKKNKQKQIITIFTFSFPKTCLSEIQNGSFFFNSFFAVCGEMFIAFKMQEPGHKLDSTQELHNNFNSFY